MPGVPSGRGCDGCVKQKKKCDQLKPACSRCSRRQIPCTGSGKQRYKFKEVGTSLMVEKTKQSRSAPSDVRILPRTPSNDATSMLSAFIQKLEVSDLRYDICWSYGDLLREVPKRLGTNAALDASVRAVTTACSDLSTCQKSQEALTRYGHALRALRTCLGDPVIARSSNTLCAVYLIWICQSWIGMDTDVAASHGGGIVQILATASYRESRDEFERLLLATIAAPVIFESMVEPTTQLNPWVRKFIVENEKPVVKLESGDERAAGDQGRPQVGRIMACLVRIPDFIRYNPELQHEIRSTYENVKTTSKKLHERLVAAAAAMIRPDPDLDPVKPTVRVPRLRVHAFYQRMYALVLCFEVILNGILRAYNPEDVVLEKESLHNSQEIINLSLEASFWRPIGAAFIPVCLMSAWAATTDVSGRAQLEKAWCECWTDLPERQLTVCAVPMASVFDKLRFAVLRANLRSLYDS